MADNQ